MCHHINVAQLLVTDCVYYYVTLYHCKSSRRNAEITHLEFINAFADLLDDAGTLETQYERSFGQGLDRALSGH